MKKKTARLLAMLISLALLIGLCFLVLSPSKEEEQEEAPEATYDATDIDGASVSAITVTNENGVFAFEKKDGLWVLSEAPSLELQSGIVAQLVNTLSELTGTNRIEGVTDLTQYELDKPGTVVSVTDKNGKNVYRIGALNSMIDAYYFCSEQAPSYVFTVAKTTCEDFSLDASEFLVLDFPQPPEAETIKSVELKNEEGSILYTAISEFLYNDEEQVTDDNPSGAVYSHTATKTSGGKTEDYPYADMDRMMQSVASAKPSGEYFFSVSDNEKYFSDYTTLTVTYTVREKLDAENADGAYVDTEMQFIIYFSQDSEGNFYAKPDLQSPLIYKMSPAPAL